MVLLHFKVEGGPHGPWPAQARPGLSSDAARRAALGAHAPRPRASTQPPRAPRTPPHTPWGQNSDQDQFLFEASVSHPAGDVSRELAEVHNLRHRITRLRLEGGELAKHGPAKAPDAEGIDSYQEGAAEAERGPHYCMDPTGRRTGEGARPRCAELGAAPRAEAGPGRGAHG